MERSGQPKRREKHCTDNSSPVPGYAAQLRVETAYVIRSMLARDASSTYHWKNDCTTNPELLAWTQAPCYPLSIEVSATVHEPVIETYAVSVSNSGPHGPHSKPSPIDTSSARPIPPNLTFGSTLQNARTQIATDFPSGYSPVPCSIVDADSAT
jgi:hypothetical protein